MFFLTNWFVSTPVLPNNIQQPVHTGVISLFDVFIFKLVPQWFLVSHPESRPNLHQPLELWSQCSMRVFSNQPFQIFLHPMCLFLISNCRTSLVLQLATREGEIWIERITSFLIFKLFLFSIRFSIQSSHLIFVKLVNQNN